MCAHAVRVAIEKIPGVSGVKVSLNEGVAAVSFAPGNRATVQQIRAAIRKNGFTPKAAAVTVAGQLMQRGGALLLAVPATNELYVLQNARRAGGQVAALRRRGGGAVTVTGDIPESAASRSAAPLPLLVRSVVAGGA